MKTRILISLLLLLFSSIIYGQNNYDGGFKAGYKAGYCYNDFGCISPIPPITPVPLIGERSDNYKDGYNRGFKRGLEDKQKAEHRENSKEDKDSRTAQPAKAEFIDTYVPIDYNLLMNMLSIKQSQNERNEQLRKEKSGIMKRSLKESRIPNVQDKRIKEILKRDQNEEYIEKAYQYLSEGNSDMFLRYSLAAIRQGKNSLKLHYDRGRVYESIGDNKNAKKEYKKAEKGGWKEAKEALYKMKKKR